MISFQDCLGFSELTEEEILVIAQHEHIPEIAALELGNHLAQIPEGERLIKAMILEDIQQAEERGDLRRAEALRAVLRRFMEHHAGAAPGGF